MKKIIKLCLLVFCIFSSFVMLDACKAKKKVNEFPEIVNKLDSYSLTGKLYTMFPTGTKEALVTVYYQKPDNYRVEIDTATNGDKQIILKNSDGVFVLVPSLNKSFELKTSWPINSSYPYLLQSISKDYVNDEDKIVKTDNGQTTVEMDIKMFENANPSKQKVIFNENNMPMEVQVFDDRQNLVSRFVFLKIDENPKLNEQLFQKQETMTSSFETLGQIEYERVLTYPTYYPTNSKLNGEKISKVGDVRTSVMKYTGDVSYTIVEQYVLKTEKESHVYVDGDIYVMGENIYIINDKNVTFVANGIEYFLASNDVSVFELIKMGNSLIASIDK